MRAEESREEGEREREREEERGERRGEGWNRLARVMVLTAEVPPPTGALQYTYKYYVLVLAGQLGHSH